MMFQEVICSVEVGTGKLMLHEDESSCNMITSDPENSSSQPLLPLAPSVILKSGDSCITYLMYLLVTRSNLKLDLENKELQIRDLSNSIFKYSRINRICQCNSKDGHGYQEN